MSDFDKILDGCRALSDMLTDVIFIGGVAVYQHAISRKSSVPPEASHDADFMISRSDYGELRDLEEVTSNKRLGKHQMLSHEIEFDVYVEGANNLIVPYDAAAASAVVLQDLKVASLEHLLVLKLEALGQRGHSAKGEKDRRDLVQVGLLLGKSTKRTLLDPYLREDHLTDLVKIAKSSIFYNLCGGNAHEAKKMRSVFTNFAQSVSS